MGVQLIGHRFLTNRPADVGRAIPTAYAPPLDRYALLERLYDGTLYTEPAIARTGERHPALPRGIRAITTLPKRAIDRWPGYLYRKGEIPYDRPASNPDLIDTWEQAMLWGGWTRHDLLTYAKRLPKLGNALAVVEVADDLREVYPRLIHPRYLVDLELSVRRDVTAYEVAIPRLDADDKPYVWHRRVDKRTVRTWEARHATESNVVAGPNPWGFVPAIWEGFADADGSDRRTEGASRLDGLLPMIHELNGGASNAHDFIARLNRQTTMVTTEQPAALARALGGAPRAGETDEYVRAMQEYRTSDRQTSDVVPVGIGSQAFPLLSNLGLADALAWVQRLEADIREALPELTLGQDLSSVRELGVRAVVETFEHDLNACAANADRGVVKLAQMGAAMMGELLREGMVPNPTAAHEPFRAFDLGSYDRGEMALETLDREVLPPTMGDRAMEAAQVERVTSVWGLRWAGLSDDDIYGAAPDGETDEAREARTRPAGILADRQTGASSASDVFSTMLATGRV